MSTSRRQFARRVLAVGAALAASSLAAPAIGGARAHVVVVGAGPAGIGVARRLAASGSVDVTLIEPKERYTTCFHGNRYLAGLVGFERITHAYPSSIAGVERVRDRVDRIDAAARTVRLASGPVLSYDRLVVAPGIDLRFDAIEGYDEAAREAMPHAYLGGPQHRVLRERIEAMPDGGLFVMSAPALPFRCPPGPYERASLIAGYFKRAKPRAKILIVDAKNQHSKQGLFHEAWARLYPGMVEWLPADMTDGGIRSVDAATMTLRAAFESFEADAANVIPPQRAGRIALEAGLADASGWCPIDPATLASTRAAHVHVVGDAIDPGEMPKSAYAADSQAAVCAASILADFDAGARGPARFSSLCWSLVAENEAVKVGASYEVRDGALHQYDAFISKLDETAVQRSREAEEDRRWYDDFVRRMFG